MSVKDAQSLDEIGHIDSLDYLDDSWNQVFSSRGEAVEYFGNLKLYSELLGVSKDQRKKFVQEKAYELTNEQIGGWIEEFGSVTEAVSYAENKLEQIGIEPNEEWDHRVETVLDWEIEDKRTQRAKKPYTDLVHDTEYGTTEVWNIGDDGGDTILLYDGSLMDIER